MRNYLIAATLVLLFVTSAQAQQETEYHIATKFERAMGLCELYAGKHASGSEPLSRRFDQNFLFDQCMITEGYIKNKNRT